MTLPNQRRTAVQIRQSMADNRARLESDLDELEERLEESFSPRLLLARHPVVTAVLGAAVGFLVFRNPALLTKSLSRLAKLSAPFVLRSLLQRESRQPRELS